MMNSGVYLILCLSNNKKYIGSSVNIKKRIIRHKSELRHFSHHNSHLQRAWDKYGEDNFSFFILELCEIEDLVGIEIFYLSEFNTTSRDKGFNFSIPRKYSGLNPSDEYRKILSDAHKGKTPKNINLMRERQRRSVNLFIDGEFIKTYESQQEASLDTGIGHKNVNNYTRGKTKKIRGFEDYHFEYTDGKPTRKIKKK